MTPKAQFDPLETSKQTKPTSTPVQAHTHTHQSPLQTPGEAWGRSLFYLCWVKPSAKFPTRAEPASQPTAETQHLWHHASRHSLAGWLLTELQAVHCSSLRLEISSSDLGHHPQGADLRSDQSRYWLLKPIPVADLSKCPPSSPGSLLCWLAREFFYEFCRGLYTVEEQLWRLPALILFRILSFSPCSLTQVSTHCSATCKDFMLNMATCSYAYYVFLFVFFPNYFESYSQIQGFSEYNLITGLIVGFMDFT